MADSHKVGVRRNAPCPCGSGKKFKNCCLQSIESQNDPIERMAQLAVLGKTPEELGLAIYPDATPIDLGDVPRDVLEDHLTRYSMEDLRSGQFLEVARGRYTFFMGHKTKLRKNRELKNDA